MDVLKEQIKPTETKIPPAKVARYTGEVVYIYAFDVAYEMTRQSVGALLGQPVAQFVVDASVKTQPVSEGFETV